MTYPYNKPPSKKTDGFLTASDFEHGGGHRPPDYVWAERDRRNAREKTVNELVFGDPPVGQRALDQRKPQEEKRTSFKFHCWAADRDSEYETVVRARNTQRVMRAFSK